MIRVQRIIFLNESNIILMFGLKFHFNWLLEPRNMMRKKFYYVYISIKIMNKWTSNILYFSSFRNETKNIFICFKLYSCLMIGRIKRNSIQFYKLLKQINFSLSFIDICLLRLFIIFEQFENFIFLLQKINCVIFCEAFYFLFQLFNDFFNPLRVI